jgi:hypothetical protein
LTPTPTPGRLRPMAQDSGIEEVARTHAGRAIDTLAEVMDDTFAEDKDRIRAAEAILDRGYGKPSQAIIQVPMAQRQRTLLASMSDDQLVAIIEKKQLPRLSGPQPVTDVPAGTQPITAGSSTAAIHGPAPEAFADDAARDSLLD